MDKRTTVGIDLAKDVFAICVLDARGAVLERKVLQRAALERWTESLPGPSIVAMEACGSAHHWGRYFAARGHTARLMAAEFVVPFRGRRQLFLPVTTIRSAGCGGDDYR